MNDNAIPIAALLEQAKEFSNSTIELLKLQAIDKSADVVSSLVSRIAIVMAVALSLITVNIGIALWVGKLLGDYFLGFFVIGGFYAILAILLHIFRHQWIKYPISNSIIKQMIKKDIIDDVRKTQYHHVDSPADN